MQLAWRVDEGSKVRLKDYDPGFVDTYTDRALAAAETEKLSEELGELQQAGDNPVEAKPLLRS